MSNKVRAIQKANYRVLIQDIKFKHALLLFSVIPKSQLFPCDLNEKDCFCASSVNTTDHHDNKKIDKSKTQQDISFTYYNHIVMSFDSVKYDRGFQ